jgi:hypothetical protein
MVKVKLSLYLIIYITIPNISRLSIFPMRKLETKLFIGKSSNNYIIKTIYS